MKNIISFFVVLFLITVGTNSTAKSAVLIDRNADNLRIGTDFGALNFSRNQNFLVQFTVTRPLLIGGADIYSASPVVIGQPVVVKFRRDFNNAPVGINLISIDSFVTEIDNIGSLINPSIRRIHTDFSPILFNPGIYYFGLSGRLDNIGLALQFNRPNSDGLFQLIGNSVQFSFNNEVASGFRLLGSAAIPEPATWAMMVIGFGAVGAAARRHQRKFAVTA